VTSDSTPPVSTFAKKKYKPVSQKALPVLGSLPEQFRIVRQIHGDPLADLPALDPNPPPSLPPVDTSPSDAISLIRCIQAISSGLPSAA
jgi:hypothetical protein